MSTTGLTKDITKHHHSAEFKPASGTVPSSFYRPELDVLRFFAFFAVFVQHAVPHTADAYKTHGASAGLAAWILSIPVGGAYGVDLFFVLSAYLITELLQREFASEGRLDVRAFYVRRILRIWPLYFSFLIVSVVVSLFRVFDDHFGVAYLLAYIFLAGNWICVLRGYPNSVGAPLWSVSLEEQFYLVWPALMRLMRGKRLVPAALCMIVLAVSTRIVLLFVGAQHPRVWCNTFARLDTIAWGILLAAWLRGRKPSLSGWMRIVLGLVAVSTWLVVARYAPLDGALPVCLLVGYPAVAAASALMVFLSLTCDLSRFPRPLSRLAVYLGRISYGLYVFHLLGIKTAVFAHVARGGGFWMFLLTSLALTIALSAMSYRYLEQPFLRLKLRYTHVLSRPGG